MWDFPVLHEIAMYLNPRSPLTFVFLALAALAASLVYTQDMSQGLTWLLLVLFTVLALCPDREGED